MVEREMRLEITADHPWYKHILQFVYPHMADPRALVSIGGYAQEFQICSAIGHIIEGEPIVMQTTWQSCAAPVDVRELR